MIDHPTLTCLPKLCFTPKKPNVFRKTNYNDAEERTVFTIIDYCLQ